MKTVPVVGVCAGVDVENPKGVNVAEVVEEDRTEKFAAVVTADIFDIWPDIFIWTVVVLKV